MTGPPVPFVQEVAGPRAVATVDLLQGQFDSTLQGNLEIRPRSSQAVERLLLSFRQVLRVTEPDETRFFQTSVLYLLHATNLVESFVHEFADKQLIKGELGLGEVLLDAGDEGRRHVDGKVDDLIRAASVPFEEAFEGLKDVLAFAFRHEDGAFTLEIDKGRDVVVAPFSGRFIDADGGDMRKILLLGSLVDVRVSDAPDLRVPLVENPGRRGHGHKAEQGHGEGLKKQGKAATLPSPGHLDRMDPMGRAVDTGKAGVEIGLVLEEIHVPPAFHRRIVDLAAAGTTAGTGEGPALPEVEIDIDSGLFLIEGDPIDEPRICQFQNRFEKGLQVIHGGTS